jgi:hypothetical protein
MTNFQQQGYENYVPDALRAQVTPLYDTVSIAAAAQPATINFFSHEVAVDGRPVTNLVEKNKITGPGNFIIGSMRFVPIGITKADFQKWMESYVLRLIRGNAEIAELEAPPEYWAGGCGPNWFSDGAAAATECLTNGLPDPRAVATLAPFTIKLTAGDHFAVRLEGVSVTPAAAHKLRVYLDGVYEKGIPT